MVCGENGGLYTGATTQAQHRVPGAILSHRRTSKNYAKGGMEKIGNREVSFRSNELLPTTTNTHRSGESISDHMYRMSIITLFAPTSLSSKINIPHCMKMALIHDMAEALVGDITPVDGVPKAEKSRRESTTMDYLTNSLLGKVNGGMTGQEIKEIWQEYEDSETLESHFVHDVDKLELILQFFEYERSGKGALPEFALVAEKIVLPEVKIWADEVLAERCLFWADKGGVPKVKTDEEKKEIESKHEEYYGDLEGK